MVISPGVPSDSAVIKKALQKKIPVISEIEFAFNFCKGKVIAITGTNGKTTTTALIGHIFNTCGVKTYTAGNIGLAFSEVALKVKENEFVALEVSSFQLDLIDKFNPDTAIILNITPDHLERYQNKLENYIASKMRIFSNQKKSNCLILNKDDKLLMKNLADHKSKEYFISLNEEQQNGAYISDDQIIFKKDGKQLFSSPVKNISIPGRT
jgi:UDP-N-acetylmuramoylalanine--D-glutamate ligase